MRFGAREVEMAGRYDKISKKDAAQVVAFNKANPVGTVVRYWKGVREGEPSGVGPTTHEASLLGGHTAVAWIQGCSSCVALSHVEVVK
jgi:hypothetical protein